MKALYLGAVAAAACLAMAAPASAQVYASIGGGVQTLDFDIANTSKATLGLIGANVGWRKSWYGVEADLFFGTNEDRINEAAKVDVKIDSAAFAYAVAFLPLGEKFDLLARAGYGHQAGQVSATNAFKEDSNDGAATYGVGAQYKFSATGGVRADYTHYDITDAAADAFTVRYVHTF